MSYTQVQDANLSVVGQEGYCEAYVEDVFSYPHGHIPSATVGWQDAEKKHTDQPPSDVCVPVWFSYNGPYGHVAVSAPDGIHSTSAQGMKIFSSVDALCSWMGEGMTYLGWSEDIAGTTIVKEAQVASSQDVADGLTIQLAYNLGLNRQPTPEEIQGWQNSNTTVEGILRSVWNSDEHKALLNPGFTQYSGPELFTKK